MSNAAASNRERMASAVNAWLDKAAAGNAAPQKSYQLSANEDRPRQRSAWELSEEEEQTGLPRAALARGERPRVSPRAGAKPPSPAEAAAMTAAVEALPRRDARGRAVFDGTYTFISGRDGSHRTYKVATQANDAEFAPGQQVLKLLTGPDNNSSFTRLCLVDEKGQPHSFIGDRVRKAGFFRKQQGTLAAQIAEVFLMVAAGTPRGRRLEAAGYRVEVSRACYRCGRRLTTPESISRGVGPECLKA